MYTKSNYNFIYIYIYISYLCFSGAELLLPDVRQSKLPDVAPVETSYSVRAEQLDLCSILDVSLVCVHRFSHLMKLGQTVSSFPIK